MKKSVFIALVAFVAISFTGCLATHSGMLLNQTNVQLTQNNFSYVAQNQTGDASITYFLGFGGMSKKSLLFEAVEELKASRKLEAGQAWVNQTVTYKTAYQLGIIVTTTCVVTADVIQFN